MSKPTNDDAFTGPYIAVPVREQSVVLGLLLLSADSSCHQLVHADVQAAIAGHFNAALQLAKFGIPTETPAGRLPPQQVAVQHEPSNNSVFINGVYLIKGVAAQILLKLLGDYLSTGRTEFSNRDLRLAPALRRTHNLEVRLSMLQARLAMHDAGVLIEKIARGRFRLRVDKQLSLTQ